MKIFHSHTLNPMVFNEHQSSQFHIFQTQLFSLQDSWLLKWNGGGAFSCQSPPFKEAGLNMRPLSTAQVVLTAPPLAPPISSCRCGGVHSEPPSCSRARGPWHSSAERMEALMGQFQQQRNHSHQKSRTLGSHGQRDSLRVCCVRALRLLEDLSSSSSPSSHQTTALL